MNAYHGRFDSTVEIAHTYAPDHATPFTGNWRSEGGFELPIFLPPTSAQLRWKEIAQAYSTRPLILALIDDIGVEDELASLMTDLSVVEAVDPDDVYRESDYVEAAATLIEKLQLAKLPKGFRLNPDGTKLITGTGKKRSVISLTGFRGVDDPMHPSCQMLDAAWTLDRLESVASSGANILPVSFRPQQEQVRAIAKVLPEFQGYNFLTIFVTQSGQVESTLRWNLDQAM